MTRRGQPDAVEHNLHEDFERLRAAAYETRKALETDTARETGEQATCIALRNLDARTVTHRSRSDLSAYDSGRSAGRTVNTNRGRALT